MKLQALFSSKHKSKKKKLKCRLLQFLFGALRVNKVSNNVIGYNHSCKSHYFLFSRVD